MSQIHFKGTRYEARQLVYRLREMLVGKAPDALGIAKGFTTCIGFAALSDVKDAFIEKARAGTDEMGVQWQPLKPATIARRRLGPDDLKIPTIKLRSDVVKRYIASKAGKELLARLMLSLSPEQAKSRVRQIAGQLATGKTGLNKVETLGYRTVEILRDTGVLFNSMSPGVLSSVGPDASYTKPTAKGGDQQIFNVRPGAVVVGSNVPYAATHQYGRGHVPQRKMLPVSTFDIPEVWWDRWLAIGEKALEAGARLLFERN